MENTMNEKAITITKTDFYILVAAKIIRMFEEGILSEMPDNGYLAYKVTKRLLKSIGFTEDDPIVLLKYFPDIFRDEHKINVDKGEMFIYQKIYKSNNQNNIEILGTKSYIDVLLEAARI